MTDRTLPFQFHRVGIAWRAQRHEQPALLSSGRCMDMYPWLGHYCSAAGKRDFTGPEEVN
jgi:hypothetical protein